MSELAETDEGLPFQALMAETVVTEHFFEAERARLFQALVVITRSRSEAEHVFVRERAEFGSRLSAPAQQRTSFVMTDPGARVP